MNPAVQLLVFDDAGRAPAEALRERLSQHGVAAAPHDMLQVADDPAWRPPDVAIIVAGGEIDPAAADQAATFLDRLNDDQVATLVWGDSDRIRWAGGPRVEWLDPNVSLDEIVGRLSALAHYGPLVRQLERELNHMRRLGGQLNRYFSEIDQEMRLAGRLQRDFLPAQLPDVPGLRFGAIYRPASWVSGDLYDAFRIDDVHVGLFVADAMGHGVAAGLLTMFLRQALAPRGANGSAGPVGPVEAITSLNDCLLRQKLPGCQFVTAAYAVYDVQSRELRLARAGHPYPLHVRPDGEIQPILASGALLGLADIPSAFEEVRLTLAAGEKLIFYTDGLEDDFLAGNRDRSQPDTFTPELREWARLGAPELVEALGTHLDNKEGSLHPPDDVTLLAMEVR